MPRRPRTTGIALALLAATYLSACGDGESTGTTTIAGRDLFALFYNRAMVPGPDNYMMSESGALYLYFPEDFENSRTIYEFFISKLFDPSSSFSASHTRDLPEIEPVIAGLRYHDETEIAE